MWLQVCWMKIKKMMMQTVKNSITNYYKKDKIRFFMMIGLLLFIIIRYTIAKIDYSKLDKQGLYTVGKFVEYVRMPKTRTYYFEFYTDKEKIRGFDMPAPQGFYKNIGKYYKLKYLPDDPNIFKVYFCEEITDSVEIIKAGFKGSL